jgi:hypothetical protein
MKILKKILLLVFLMVCSVSGWSQKKDKKNSAWASLIIEGKTFSVNIYSLNNQQKDKENAIADELVFVGGKFYSRKMGSDFKYAPDSYSCYMDTSRGTVAVTFVAFSLDENGDVAIFWKGTVTGNSIKGTMHWFRHGTTKMFSGGLKYDGEAK